MRNIGFVIIQNGKCYFGETYQSDRPGSIHELMDMLHKLCRLSNKPLVLGVWYMFLNNLC